MYVCYVCGWMCVCYVCVPLRVCVCVFLCNFVCVCMVIFLCVLAFIRQVGEGCCSCTALYVVEAPHGVQP